MLLEHIEGYMRRTKTSPSRFGREALGDPNFVTNLREGRTPRKRTARRVLAFIAAHGPVAGRQDDGR